MVLSTILNSLILRMSDIWHRFSVVILIVQSQ